MRYKISIYLRVWHYYEHSLQNHLKQLCQFWLYTDVLKIYT